MFINNCFAEENLNTTINSASEVPSELTQTIEAPNQWTSFIPIVLMLIVFYFLLIRPQEKRRKSHEELIFSVKKGEEVILNSGIYATIVKINDDNTIEAEISKGYNIKILKSSILEITSRAKLKPNKLIS